MVSNIAVIGAGGAIGGALTRELMHTYPECTMHPFSRSAVQSQYKIDYHSEQSLASAADFAAKDRPLDLLIIAIGILHDNAIMPEKSLRELSAEKFQHLFAVNTIAPALVCKHFLPKLNKDNRSVCALLSARVGSISDNRLGGWYAYRASKAALNMIIRNAALEMARQNKQAIVIGLHPGTVDSHLSKPFQRNVPDGKLFTPEYSAQKLLKVLPRLTPQESGKCFAWDGQEIEP